MATKIHAVDRYARDVGAGTIVAGPLVRLACERHVRDRKGAKWIFDPVAADRVLAFFEHFLRLPDTVDADGEPAPFALTPWQIFCVGSLFGWQDRAGVRRFRDGYIETGKGSGKTPLLAGIGLYGLLMDGERGAEIYSAAVDKDQARILFRDAQRMIEVSPDLRARLEVHVDNIGYAPLMATFRPFSREQAQQSGYRPHFTLVDEVHEHPTGETIHKLKAGVKRRRQPLHLEITNSGYDRTSICWAHHEHARRVLERTVRDDRSFAYVCSLDAGDDPLTDDKCWPKANPAIGVTVTREYLRRQVQNAKNIPAETNTVLRLNFCVWTQAVERFLTAAAWQACAATVPPEALVGRPCFAGLDLGQSDDFSAFARVWLLEDGRQYVTVRVWLPSAAIEKYVDRPYAEWIRGGWLEVTDGEVTDYDVIERAVLADCRAAGVRELAYDKRFAEQLANHLRGAGVEAIDVPQGFYLTGAVKKVSELVTGAGIAHDGNPIMGWMVDNLVVKHGPDKTMRPDKEKSKEKIDGPVALILAESRIVVQAIDTTSVYESRGLVTL